MKYTDLIERGSSESQFQDFLSVLAYDGLTMHQVSASKICYMAMSGTSATLLAHHWESALLINVDNDALRRILGNETAYNAIIKIDSFRTLGGEIIETIVNTSEDVKKAKRERKDLTSKEKELKSKRKQVGENLTKLATRTSMFMYLTDYREQTLEDVISQLGLGFFRKMTDLDVAGFELLVSLGVFNDALMNDSVYKFRRYESSSLTCTGINKHKGERLGLFDTPLSEFDYQAMKQQESMIAQMVWQRQALIKTQLQSLYQAPRRRYLLPSRTIQLLMRPWTNLKKRRKTRLPSRKSSLTRLKSEKAVFQKAFEYSTIVMLGDGYIEIAFDNNNRKKKPSRKAMFPRSFFQELLQIG